MREYDEIVETIRNQGFVTMENVRALCELGIPAVNICVKTVSVEDFLEYIDNFVNL